MRNISPGALINNRYVQDACELFFMQLDVSLLITIVI